jgi:hypothetical protein
MKRPNVKFTEFALRGLANIFSDEERRASAKQSIEWYIKREEALGKSRPVPAFGDKKLLLFPLSDMKIMFERGDDENVVWSVSLGNSDQF